MAFDPKNYGSQLLGLDRDSHVVERLATAMESPKAYFADRKTQMDAVLKKARDTFSEHYQKYKALKLSDKQAKEKAEDITTKIMAVIYDEFNAEWPANIGSLALNKLMKESSYKAENGL